uniref:Sushi domain-containing protein 1 isoform X3 n=1 Tax=Geotrypetes seraphini TaxID=260995 RepID=A0A6P8Q4J4_GEOSA|nr:sushi domain-containing protein 1 isoform X3 [Geotrypetes seraphini]XP_033782084.1 sushi domain-containing protein 1 isoform X3 [Geotrypetes seraphini]XP_033782093.1 sushi domain-containing protein 1 isoform X3 [Geotrypetes seraphini]XP_033782102.1 sushi domain-containing protein 1 isoform X3 [Geotrypetes seraphini]
MLIKRVPGVTQSTSSAMRSAALFPGQLRVLLLLLLLQGSFRGLRTTLLVDVCTTCHKNATCQQKEGKNVCICNYGLVGNGRTFCQDKDECQIGANKICGEHTACHNTYGSFYCICLEGYRPSNDNETFIPNDGTFCTDIDECEISGLCGNGGRCWNLPGSYECSCLEGYRSENGSEFFQPAELQQSCKAIDCGLPMSLPNSFFELQTNTTFESEVTYKCLKGFIPESGNSNSVCTADGKWEGASLACKVMDCGEPPEIQHSYIVGNYTTVFGSEVYYDCKEGFYSERRRSVTCTENGIWETLTSHCKALDCGTLPSIPYATPSINSNTTYGSTIVYECNYGYVIEGGNQTVTCNAQGQWEGVIGCREIDCGNPVMIPHAEKIWNNSTRLGSVVHYRCRDGFYGVGNKNYSQCTVNQTWEIIAFFCKEVECGTPLRIQNADLVWSGNSILGSVVYYECKEGFEFAGGKNFSVCQEDGIWEESSCTAVKGDFVSNATVYGETCLKWIKVPRRTRWRISYEFNVEGQRWHWKEFVHEMILNFASDEETPVLCLDLYPDSNYTVDLTTPSVMQINLTIHMGEEENLLNVSVFNETCLKWRRNVQKTVLTITHTGHRWSQKEFLHEMVFNFTVDEDIPVLCLDLYPDTNYTMYMSRPSIQLSIIIPAEHSKAVKDEFGDIFASNEICMRWRRGIGRAEVKDKHTLYIQGIRSDQKKSFQEMAFNLNMTEESPEVCLELHLGISYIINVTVPFVQLLVRIIITTPTDVKEHAMDDIKIVNETCLTWKRHAEKKETYLFQAQGRRWYHNEFFHEMFFNFTTYDASPVLCLDLYPGTNYTVNVTGSLPVLSTQIFMTTQIKDPPVPEVEFVAVQGPSPRLSLRTAEAKNGPISSYQVVVLLWDSQNMFMCDSLTDISFFSNVPKFVGYLAAEFQPEDVTDNMEFSLGDRQYYGAFYNAPLRQGKDYCVILRIVSEWDKVRAQSCVSWAQIKGLSPSLWRVAAVGFGSVTTVCFLLFLSFSVAWYCKSR